MGDHLRFFSSAAPDSSHGHGHTQNGYGPEFAGAWMEPGAYSDYGPEDYAARAEDEMQRLISTDGPTTSWLYSDYYSEPQPDAHASTAGPAPIQRELIVGSANDPLEEEADAVAERVMRNPRDFYLDPRVSSFQPYTIGGRGEQVVARLTRAAQEEEAAQFKAEAPEISGMGEQDEEMQYRSLQRNLAGMDEDAKETLGYTHAFEKSDEDEDMGTTTSMYMQREGAASPEGGTVSPELQQRIEGVRNIGGEKLPESEREFFESRMGHDFGDVRIHTGSEAAQISRDVNAKAFTIGRDVVFGEGEYKPGTPEGRRLMAHELTHTVQQGRGPIRRIKDFVQRQIMRQRSDREEIRISPDLLRPKDLRTMSEKELRQLHDRLRSTLWDIYKFSLEKDVSLSDGKRLSLQVAQLLEVAKNVALSRGLTFSESEVVRMRSYFNENASKEKKDRDDCITALNSGLRALLKDQKLPGGTIKGSQIGGTDLAGRPGTMDNLDKSGLIDSSVVIEFNNRGGITEPKEPDQSPWDTLRGLAMGDVGWVMFGMSLVDGYHSVTLSLDNSNPFSPTLYWSDQTPRPHLSGGPGWIKYGSKKEFDQRILSYTKTVWNESLINGKHRRKTRLTFWRIRKPS